jgi:anti-sigma-K factor RskA
MTDHRTPDPDDLLAAEYALGLLTGAALARAEALARTDTEFRDEAGRWAGRLSPLLDEVPDVAPPPALWSRIAARIESETATKPNVVVQLRRRVNVWRAYGAAATALAASLAWLLVTRPPPAPPLAPPQEASPMVATMAAPGSPARLVATWSPGSRTLVIAAAVAPAAAPGHAHQLWMIAPGGPPHPMGMMPREGAMRATLPAEVAAQLREGVTLAVSVEPEGGSPTGLPTGAVIAAGPLVRT